MSWGAGPVRDRWGIGNSASPGRRSDKIVNGKSGISPEMAIRLTKAFGSTEETKLIPVLVQAVKELETKNEKMSEQISVLTSEIAGLRIDIDDSKRAR